MLEGCLAQANPREAKLLFLGVEHIARAYHLTDMISYVYWVGPSDERTNNDPLKAPVEYHNRDAPPFLFQKKRENRLKNIISLRIATKAKIIFFPLITFIFLLFQRGKIVREKARKVEIKSVSLRKKGTSDFTIAKKRERERDTMSGL